MSALTNKCRHFDTKRNSEELMREVNERFTEQPRTRGTNDDEYQIYCENARALGWYVKTYDEWLNS